MPVKQLVWDGTSWHGRIGDVAPDPEPGGLEYDPDHPARLLAGESLRDGIPAGVPEVNAWDYSGSSDIYTVLQAIETSGDPACYVQMKDLPYYVNSLRAYGANDWRGFANANRKVMGLIGHDPGVGADPLTQIEMAPGAVAASSGARNYVLDPPGPPWSPVPLTSLYFSNTGTSVPLFISGIAFRGTLQSPYGVYSANARTKLPRNSLVPSPLPYRGLSMWRAIPGAHLQHCRFDGFGFTLNNAPPYEMGWADSNYGHELVRRIEADSRIAADIDPTRPLACGGFMVNKPQDVHWEDSYQHHTRRSGFATNTNTNSQLEAVYAKRVRIDHIADPSDGWAGDNGLFAGSNVEEIVGTFTYEDCWISVNPAKGHINLALPFKAGNGQTLVLPNHPIIIVRKGFRSDDTLYGGCLRITVPKNPNSSGVNPAWTKIHNLGINGADIFDCENGDDDGMTGVFHTAWNPSMKPDTHFVVVMGS